MPAADVVIVGGGLAGAATAYALVRRGVQDVWIVEKEVHPGRHASSQNAAMLRQFLPGAPDIVPLAVEGAQFLRSPPDDLPSPLLRACGSLFLVDRAGPAVLAGMTELWRHRVGVTWWTRRQAIEAVPLLEGVSFAGAVHSPRDGVVDVAGLLEGFLRAAIDGGARLLNSREVRRIVVAHRHVQAVETDRERIATPVVVNAAGAWAGAVGRAAGTFPPPLQPHRRHLFLTPPLLGLDPQWPYVWDLAHEFYFRPESGGLLLSPCDQAEHPAGEVRTEPAAAEWLASKLQRFAPALFDLPIRRAWAGLRTLTPDGHFVVGVDPRIRGFVWCAGLGGHGVTVSPAVGRLAAEAVLGRASAPAHAPARFRPAPTA